MSRCKACGQEIIWINTKAGKAIPCDPGYFRYYEGGGHDRIVTRDGRVIAGTIIVRPEPKEMTLPKGLKAHFATCPAAEQFRRR